MGARIAHRAKCFGGEMSSCSGLHRDLRPQAAGARHLERPLAHQGMQVKRKWAMSRVPCHRLVILQENVIVETCFIDLPRRLDTPVGRPPHHRLNAKCCSMFRAAALDGAALQHAMAAERQLRAVRSGRTGQPNGWKD